MKNVVVTGANGFIGKALTKKLINQGVHVYAVVTDLEGMKELVHPNLTCIKAFFEEYSELDSKINQPIDVFFHFAWQGVFGDAFKDYNLQLNNAKYSADAVMLAVKLRVKKFVLASTVNTLETKKYFNQHEFSPRFTNIYATAKLASEMIGKTLAFNYGIDFNCGIIGMVYGENNHSKMIPNIVMSNLLYNRETNLIDGNTPYDIIYINDVCDAFIAIAEKGVNFKTYYVGHRQTRTFKEIWDEVRKIINPSGVLNYGFYKEVNAIDYSLINMNELFIDTGFEPTTDFKMSIQNTIKWIEESGEFK